MLQRGKDLQYEYIRISMSLFVPNYRVIFFIKRACSRSMRHNSPVAVPLAGTHYRQNSFLCGAGKRLNSALSAHDPIIDRFKCKISYYKIISLVGI